MARENTSSSELRLACVQGRPTSIYGAKRVAKLDIFLAKASQLTKDLYLFSSSILRQKNLHAWTDSIRISGDNDTAQFRTPSQSEEF